MKHISEKPKTATDLVCQAQMLQQSTELRVKEEKVRMDNRGADGELSF